MVVLVSMVVVLVSIVLALVLDDSLLSHGVSLKMTKRRF